jgi:signal transduction histidine kinase/DNA-binding response OmpR family regulator
MKTVARFFTSNILRAPRKAIISFIVILALFASIVINYFIEGKVHNSVKNHSSTSAMLVQHARYKQVIDKTNFTLSQLDNNLSNYILTGNETKFSLYKEQVNALQDQMMLIKKGADVYIPKYLVNVLMHKIKNRLIFQDELLASYRIGGKNTAMQLLNNAQDRTTYLQYAQSEADLVQELNKKIDRLNTAMLSNETKIINLDDRWNMISFVLMLLIALLVLYQTAKISFLNKELHLAVKKQKHAQQVKDQFLSNMTHELRTPLNSILGYTNLLLKKPHQPEVENWIQAVNSSGNMLLEIVNDVLDYSKLESGYLHLYNEPFEIDKVLGNLKNIMTNRAESKGISLVVLKDDSLPAVLKGDEKKLKQILINLTGNAIKFTEKGTVKIEVMGRKQIGDKFWLEFAVSDTGIGISPENLLHIFERFYQVEDRYSRKYSGTGLGLPIVKELVDMQGGSIVVKSNVGTGTTFSFALPFETVSAIAEENNFELAPVKSLHVTKRKILVVDDHELNRDLMVLLLKEYNCICETASNGREAIEKLNYKKFDLVLMDVQMPEVNGIDTTQYIRNAMAIDTPIIACTAFSQPAERQSCFDAGMNDYLSKPVDEKELLRILNKYLDDSNNLAGSASVVNFEQITKIAGHNKEFTTAILSKAINLIPEELESLRMAIENMESLKVREVAHSMCSTIGLMGASPELMATVKKIQYSDIKTVADREQVRKLYNEVQANVAEIIRQLRNYLAA